MGIRKKDLNDPRVSCVMRESGSSGLQTLVHSAQYHSPSGMASSLGSWQYVWYATLHPSHNSAKSSFSAFLQTVHGCA
jgi:hypothetical protein